MYQKNRTGISNIVLITIMIIAVEIMFFAALISAYIVNLLNDYSFPIWPPPNQPRLPLKITLFNSILLLSSGITILLIFGKNKNRTPSYVLITGILGTLFLSIQGYEWFKLLRYSVVPSENIQSLTINSSLLGSFFYTLIGAHALHVIVGVLILIAMYVQVLNQSFSSIHERLKASVMYWIFVVLIWPILYVLVYLLQKNPYVGVYFIFPN